jgi:hypothetical protein
MQRLLNFSPWDEDACRDALARYAGRNLGDPAAVLVVDETGFLKKGTRSAGVARQYTGTAGRVENAQVGVFLAYAAPDGSRALIDRELYLPGTWAGDRDRCRAAGIGDEVAFATKPQLARAMIERAVKAGVPFSWVAGDEAYGGNPGLREWLEKEKIPYVLGVACNAMIATAAGWQRLSCADGSKGPRLYDWAFIATASPEHWLLVRRSLHPGEKGELELAFLPLLLAPPGHAPRARRRRRRQVGRGGLLRRGQERGRTDAAGATHVFAAAVRERGCSFSLGFGIDERAREAILRVPARARAPAYDIGGEPRDGAQIAEITGCVNLAAWPAGSRLIVRRERPRPGAQLRFTDASGHRFTAFLTDTQGGQLASLEVRHRSRARVEDRIRAGKATGLRNLPCRGYQQNKAWLELSLAATDLLTRARSLCFTGDLARCEPAAFRYRLTSNAGRLVRTGRRWQLRLDRDWPWAAHLATAFARLRAAPWPA